MNCRIAALSSAAAGSELPPEFAAKLRRADPHIAMAVAAAHQVLADRCGLVGEDGDSCGLVLASAFGPMETNFQVLDQVVFGAPTSPTLFSHSVFNGAAGYVSAVLGVRGSSLSVTDFSFPFFRSLDLAALLLAGSGLKACLAVQVETYSRLLEDAARTHAPGAKQRSPGAVCWLLQKADESGARGPVIESLSLPAAPVDSRGFPTAAETLTVNGSGRVCGSALETAEALSELVRTGVDQTLDCRVESASGSVSISIRN